MSTVPPGLQAYRASLLHFHADPAFAEHAYAWHEDGLLVVEDGRVQAAGDYAALAPTLPAGVDGHRLPRQDDHARLHRHPPALSRRPT